jgi:hypothetical protein
MHREQENMTKPKKTVKPSRRDFLKASAPLAVVAQLDVARGAFAAGSDTTGAYGMGDVGRRHPDSITDRAADSPYQCEHDDLLASIVGSGPHLFAADYAATSSMTAVLGRMATYSGKVLTWEEAVNSQLSLLPKDFSLAANPPAMPDAAGYYPFAMPGVTKAF